MSAQLAISVDNKIQTLTSGEAGDILDVYLAEANVATTQNITLQLVRNCCADGAITIVLPPRYVFSLTNIYDAVYIPPGLSANDRLAKFTLVGIDETLIDTYEVYTNADDPDGNTFVWKEYTAAQAFTTGFDIYYLDGNISDTQQVRITTIDGYVYLLDVLYTWGTAAPPTATTTAVTISSQSSVPTGLTVDFVGNTITFNTDDWGLTSVTDDVFLDGVYNYSLTQTETGADKVEIVSQFFNVKLRCLVTTYLAANPTDTMVATLMHALDLADECSLSTKYKCALYERVIRKLILANQVSTTSALGCNCGCS